MYLENVYVEVTRCLRDTNCNQKSNQTLANAFLRLKRIIGLDAKWLESHCATASHLNEKGTEKYLRGMKCKTALSVMSQNFSCQDYEKSLVLARDKRAGKMHANASSLTRSANTPRRVYCDQIEIVSSTTNKLTHFFVSSRFFHHCARKLAWGNF